MLVDCLGALRQVAKRRSVIEELGRRIAHYRAEAERELEKREDARASGRENKPGQPATPPDPQAEMRARFEERHLRELAHGRPLLIEWFLVSQALLENRKDEARRCLEQLMEAGHSSDILNEWIAAALADLGNLDTARTLLEAVLQSDSENPIVHSQLAAIHFEAGHFDEAIASATESLSLLYFQPGIHALLGHALMETNRLAEAEQELRVAVSQSPRHLKAHELLGRLYRKLGRPSDAFAHEGRALSLRNELAAANRRASERQSGRASEFTTTLHAPRSTLHAPRPSEVDRSQLITIVSGLPRSGTSMMMQFLVAAGLEALTDSLRPADEDNPLGYFEFRPASDLAKDVAWLPRARGRVVKIVAQLLAWLPANEHYQIILMERDLGEIVASQNAMLVRLGRRGAGLSPQQLMNTYAEQLQRARSQLERRSEIRIITVNYAELLAQPEAGVELVADFVGEPFDRGAAIRAIRPHLRRQKVDSILSSR